MKKIYFLLLAFSFFITANAQIVNIPDANFKAILLQANTLNKIAKNLSGVYFKIDANNDKQIQETEALQVGELTLGNFYSNVSSLIGVEKFTNLTVLECSNYQLTFLDVTSLVKLTSLKCSSNRLSSLDVSSLVNLTSLDCSSNVLSSLVVSPLVNLTSLKCSSNQLGSLVVTTLVNLTSLDCSSNSLSSLDVSSMVNLTSLKCSSNQLSSLAVSSLINLTFLDCSSNKLSSLDVSSMVNLTSLKCSSNQLSSLAVSSLINLTFLDCSSNKLSSLTVSPLVSLTTLYCDNNSIGSLTISSLVNLTSLKCSKNQLGSLAVSSLVKLTSLDCSNNYIGSLDVSLLTNLKSLICYSNRLTSLNVSGLTNLQELDCNNNRLNSLDLSGLINLRTLNCNSTGVTSYNLKDLTKLATFNCSFNNLTSIDVSGLTNLYQLYCYSNQLTSLNVSGLKALRILDCRNNQISMLDLSGSTNLEELSCCPNQLTNIDLSGLTNLKTIDLQQNLLKSLDVSGLTKLNTLLLNSNNLETLFIKNGGTAYVKFSGNPNLKYICVDDFELQSILDELSAWGGPANCQVNSYCSFTPGGTFYTIQGNQKLDSNNNGCDANDIPISNFKYTITDGTTTGSIISDTSGNYSIPVQAGTHTVTPNLENPTYFTVSPTTVNVTFPTQTSPFSQNFCITPNGVRPDLEVTLLPLQPARPGFDAKYKLVYKNKGNTIQSGSVNLTFDDAVLDLVLTNPIASTQTANNLSWDFMALQPFETREITFTMNVNSPMETPAVIIGDILAYTVTVTSSATDETPTDNTFAFNQTVVGSYDPNDKTCLEGSVITPTLIGQYVHYTIRFENTGTFAATNVVVKDMIDLTKFDISTLVPTSASHLYTTRISDGNKVEFIFENINLPFDDANNDGYIAFKIKTKPTLVVNDSFTNEASIFFDYNFPIVTNKATSTFKTLGTPDFDFNRYFTVYPNPAKSVLNINSKEAINVKSISVYNTLGQLVLALPNSEKVSAVDVSNLKSGNYFLQIKTDKGSSSSQFVKE